MNHDENEEPQGFAFVSPTELINHQRAMADHHKMAMLEFQQSIDRLFDELKPDQCLTLYRIMQNISSTGTDTAEFFAGQLSTLLRRIHKACRTCGTTVHTSDEHVFLEMGAEAARELKADGFAAPGDEFPDEDLEPEGLMHKYKVHPYRTDLSDESVCCVFCETVYPSMQIRTAQGLECPVCKTTELMDSGETD